MEEERQGLDDMSSKSQEKILKEITPEESRDPMKVVVDLESDTFQLIVLDREQ